jgi:histidine ammonia-lyase
MNDSRRTIALGEAPLSVRDVVDAAAGRAEVKLAASPVYRRMLGAGEAVIRRRAVEGPPIYGVTTGFGASCVNEVPPEAVSELPLNLVRYHGVGTGRFLTDEESAAVLVVRAATLARGLSGVRPELLERLCLLLERRILPRIPAEGSVGASGDLTPLSYVAACVAGEREVTYEGRTIPAEEALARSGIAPFDLGPKESLAIMNGTSVMTALASLAFERSSRLARFAAALTAVGVEVMQGQASHFDRRIFEAKPHPGAITAARLIREDLGVSDTPAHREGRIQDRYSLRCAPHVIGVLLDSLAMARPMLEIEINGANDNPLIDPESGDVLHGGNFYGGHVAFVADALKTQVASVAELLERQLVLLLAPSTNGGLPENLVAVEGPRRFAHHGFKAIEIAASALVAEALKGTMPAGAFSRSTEGHNQDKVSMGTIAARDWLRSLELAETVAAMYLLALVQAADLRGADELGPRAAELHAAVRARVPINAADRRMDVDIAALLGLYGSHALPIGEIDS